MLVTGPRKEASLWSCWVRAEQREACCSLGVGYLKLGKPEWEWEVGMVRGGDPAVVVGGRWA